MLNSPTPDKASELNPRIPGTELEEDSGSSRQPPTETIRGRDQHDSLHTQSTTRSEAQHTVRRGSRERD